mmetsp:Transcript_15345/g.50392  ORF Transcript_15345/g.50392 Transcript_15345/m.50392 type:complete len:312 (+) Transcript_15345:380-1315(+)
MICMARKLSVIWIGLYMDEHRGACPPRVSGLELGQDNVGQRAVRWRRLILFVLAVAGVARGSSVEFAERAEASLEVEVPAERVRAVDGDEREHEARVRHGKDEVPHAGVEPQKGARPRDALKVLVHVRRLCAREIDGVVKAREELHLVLERPNVVALVHFARPHEAAHAPRAEPLLEAFEEVALKGADGALDEEAALRRRRRHLFKLGVERRLVRGPNGAHRNRPLPFDRLLRNVHVPLVGVHECLALPKDAEALHLRQPIVRRLRVLLELLHARGATQQLPPSSRARFRFLPCPLLLFCPRLLVILCPSL